jgi:hypothetical protein
METLTIEIREPKGLDLIRDLEALNVLKIIKKDDIGKPKAKLSDMFAGCLSSEEADDLNKYVKQSRDEWERNF